MKQILLILLTGGLLIISGCASTPVKTDNNVIKKDVNITGRYFSPMSQAIYIELKDDGTFEDRFGSRSATGKYVTLDNRVIFTPNTGKPYEYVLDGKALVYKDGSRFTKQ